MATSHRISRPDTTERSDTASVSARIWAGVIGGLAGGAVFGAMMAFMGMLPVIASMIGSDSAIVGFVLHMVISVLIGLGLTVPFGDLVLQTYPLGAAAGLAYGAVWWFLGPLLLMPIVMGMPVLNVDTAAWMSLVGHLVYGLILGVVATGVLLRRR